MTVDVFGLEDVDPEQVVSIKAADLIASRVRIAELQDALRWADVLYTNRALVAEPVPGISLSNAPGAWINRVRELLR